MASGWTPEKRAAAAERIRTWAPWIASTGPKTAAGKAVSSQNRYQGAIQPKARAAARQARQTMKAADDAWAAMECELAAQAEILRAGPPTD